MLNQKFYQVKKCYGIPAEKKVKWSYIWSLKKDRGKEAPSKDKDYYFLKGFTEDNLIEFVKSCLGLLTECSYCKIIYTITLNDPSVTPRIDAQEIYVLHPKLSTQLGNIL